MQLRSALQHAWATAVETVDTFTRQSLKASEGAQAWKDFFILTGAAFAAMERCAPVPNAPTNKDDLRAAIRALESSLNVRAKLEAYNKAVTMIAGGVKTGARYFLLALRPTEGTLHVTQYLRSELEEATDAYLALEKEGQKGVGVQAVLVSLQSVDALRRAYPNYFLDTQIFMDHVAMVMG
jgi:hypothetical protein